MKTKPTNVFGLFAIILALMSFSFLGCTLTKELSLAVWDDTLPDEQTTTIYWQGGGGQNVRPRAYNGIGVDWDISKLALHVLKLPAGNTVFELYGTFEEYGAFYAYSGATFSYEFEGGQEYTVWVYEDSLYIYSGKHTTHPFYSSGSKDLLQKIKFDFKRS